MLVIRVPVNQCSGLCRMVLLICGFQQLQHGFLLNIGNVATPKNILQFVDVGGHCGTHRWKSRYPMPLIPTNRIEFLAEDNRFLML